MYVTPTIPESHDGNHARVLNQPADLPAAIDEIVAFYHGHGLTPRVKFVSAEGDDPRLRRALANAGFEFVDEEAMRVYLHEGPSRITPNPAVRVRRLDRLDDETFAALGTLNWPRVAKVIARRLLREDDFLFVGEFDGQAVSVALLERVDGICRVDEVHTAEASRGQGAARAVIDALVADYQARWAEPLYLWTDNPIAERLYQEGGFVKLDCSFTSWTARREQ